ncbi:MAG: c-type cytochrome [Geobacteraceae bacterium]|nr:c-type cytochrome [Geobacteraceae bacterium]
MQKRFTAGLTVLAVSVMVFAGCKKETAEKAMVQPAPAPASTAASAGDAKAGEALFNQYCASCHAEGGNTVNPTKTLHRKDREANGVRTVDDVIGKMRNPGPGMPNFDENTLPEKDAKAIAEYALDTFK